MRICNRLLIHCHVSVVVCQWHLGGVWNQVSLFPELHKSALKMFLLTRYWMISVVTRELAEIRKNLLWNIALFPFQFTPMRVSSPISCLRTTFVYFSYLHTGSGGADMLFVFIVLIKYASFVTVKCCIMQVFLYYKTCPFYCISNEGSRKIFNIVSNMFPNQFMVYRLNGSVQYFKNWQRQHRRA